MGKFQDKMDQDMQIRGFSLNTRKAYLGSMRRLVAYFMIPPDRLTLGQINQYQYHLTKNKKVSWGTFNITVCAIRFFYKNSLPRDWDIQQIPYQKTGRKLPEILSPEELESLFEVLGNIKHRAILMTTYSAGLRLDEVIHLKVSDIDSTRMTIRIDQGKGRKDRYVMLSESLLPILREYWKAVRPSHWLFPGIFPGKPLNRASVQKIFQKAKNDAGISKRVSVHSLRHSFATHLLENGVNIRVIQRLLGHKSIRSTEIYTHVARNYLHETSSPLDGFHQLLPKKLVKGS